MKKRFQIITTMIITLISVKNVKADTTMLRINNTLPSSNNYCSLSGCNNSYEQAKEDIMNFYNTNYREDYPYYSLVYKYIQGNKLVLIISKDTSYEITANLDNYIVSKTGDATAILHTFSNNSFITSTSEKYFYGVVENNNENYYSLIESNIDYIMSGNNYEIEGFYRDNIEINVGTEIPTYNNLIQYESWADYIADNNPIYTEVNLDNYEYVILSLKNYNQTQAFQTNLQVKGQIGITPVYNYGQTSKDNVTGVQVQDRCNISYENYTSYPFYIIQSDLQNNAIYYVKECENNSSFKFDNTIFDVTYVTQANMNSPTVTINGQTYDTIPYEDLPSTATQNEENNYIPGESGSATDTGGLDSAIKSAQQNLSSIWNTFTYFTDFVGQIFSSLPSELHTILLSAFIISITIGIIKLFVK